ncbi:hypothetical protein QEN19_002343 [Hanseniaspora menglaensis]
MTDNTINRQGSDFELQPTIRPEASNAEAEHPTVRRMDSPLRQNFHRMSEYFNILDRVFHYKKVSPLNNNDRANTINTAIRRNNAAGNSRNFINNTSDLRNESESSLNPSEPVVILEQTNDGVFSNLSAKPESSRDRRERLLEAFHQQLQINNSAGNLSENEVFGHASVGQGVYNINQLYEQLSSGATTNQQQQQLQQNGGRAIDDGEVERLDKPPTYQEAHNDNAPSYWDLSPEGSIYYDEICVMGLPAGSIINFIWNGIVSASFQFFGFLITFILHTSHAAKEGSRCGLGITFILLGFRTMPNNVSNKVGKGKEIPRLQSLNPSNHDLSVFYKGSDTNNLDVVENFENEAMLKEKLETHTFGDSWKATTTTLSPVATSTGTSGSLFNFYHHNNDQFDKAQLVKTDDFESHLSHGSEEKYDNTSNNTVLKLISILLFVVGTFIIIQSFYQYYKIKMMERKLLTQQERIEDLRDQYYNTNSNTNNNDNNIDMDTSNSGENNEEEGNEIQSV